MWMVVASPTAPSCRRGFLVVAVPAPRGSSSSWLLAFAAAACRAMRTWRSSSSGGVLCGCGLGGLGGLLWSSWACGVAGFLIFFVLAFLRGVCASALASSTHRFLSQRDKKQGAPARAGDLPAQPATFVVDPKSRSSKMFLFHRTPRLDCARNTSLTPSPRRTRRPPSPSWRPSCGSPRQRWPGHYTRGQHPPCARRGSSP